MDYSNVMTSIMVSIIGGDRTDEESRLPHHTAIEQTPFWQAGQDIPERGYNTGLQKLRKESLIDPLTEGIACLLKNGASVLPQNAKTP